MIKYTKPTKVEGKIILQAISFNQVIEKIVTKNNDTSGKISVPKDLIGKKVYVVWEK